MKEQRDTWNEILAKLIQKADKPLRRKDILEIIRKEGWAMETDSISVYLFNAVKAGVLGHVKIYPSKKGYYVNPDWCDPIGNLKEEYKIKPYWENEYNKNKPIRVSHT